MLDAGSPTTAFLPCRTPRWAAGALCWTPQSTPKAYPFFLSLQDAKRNALRANGLCWLACGGMHLYNAGAGVQVRFNFLGVLHH